MSRPLRPPSVGRAAAVLLAALLCGCGAPATTVYTCAPECPAGLHCTAGGCALDVQAAAPDLASAVDLAVGCAACPAEAPYCDSDGNCVACLIDGHCPAGQVCVALGRVRSCQPGCSGARACPGALACCDGACRDTATDPASCGACGAACTAAHATPTCAAGHCALSACEAGWADCDADPATGCEANLLDDPAHCGACGAACHLPGATAGCNGACYVRSCDFGRADCNDDPVDGCELDVMSDPRHCGGCDAVCGPAPHALQGCVLAQCALTACDAGWADCDGSPGDGCEVAVASDGNNCGACGLVCGKGQVCKGGACTCPNCSFPNSTSACKNLQCTWLACLPGFGNCDGKSDNGCEVALDSDSKNCGACGHACDVNQSCSGGLCTDAALSFDFEENGGDAVLDGSPLHNDGTLMGNFTRVPGHSGQGVHFDGTAYITVPDAPSLDPAAVTLEVWVNFDRCTVNHGGIQDVLGKDLSDGGGGRQYLLNQQEAGFFRAHALVAGNFNYIDGVTPCVAGAWTHLAETYDGTTLILYVNGQIDVQKVLGGPLQGTNTTLTLGEQASGSYRVNGIIDEVRIFPYARTAQDIAADAK